MRGKVRYSTVFLIAIRFIPFRTNLTSQTCATILLIVLTVGTNTNFYNTDMYVYRDEIYNRWGYIHKLYRAEMSALYKGNSQGYFYGTVYGS